MERDFSRHLSKKDTKMVNRYMKKMLKSLVIREMQIKTLMRYHFMATRMTIIKKVDNSDCWRRCGDI